MDAGAKRKAGGDDRRDNDKRRKTKKQWRVPKSNDYALPAFKTLQAGDSGIWATCNKTKEGKCVGELRDLFSEYARQLYADQLPGSSDAHASGADDIDIEAEINAEVSDMRKPTSDPLFANVKIDTPCVVFFKTRAPVEPVSFVQRICEDALAGSLPRRTRFTNRLSPITLMARADEEGLHKLTDEVLAPHFFRETSPSLKYAIRPNIRNHHELSRDKIIKQVASAVGSKHQVNLTNYDRLIIVEVYKNVVGMSVVDSNFERLKRYNLAEIFAPTNPTPQTTAIPKPTSNSKTADPTRKVDEPQSAMNNGTGQDEQMEGDAARKAKTIEGTEADQKAMPGKTETPGLSETQ